MYSVSCCLDSLIYHSRLPLDVTHTLNHLEQSMVLAVFSSWSLQSTRCQAGGKRFPVHAELQRPCFTANGPNPSPIYLGIQPYRSCNRSAASQIPSFLQPKIAQCCQLLGEGTSCCRCMVYVQPSHDSLKTYGRDCVSRDDRVPRLWVG